MLLGMSITLPSLRPYRIEIIVDAQCAIQDS